MQKDRTDECSVVDLQYGWNVRFREDESRRDGWEIAGLLVEGPVGLLGLSVSPNGRGCLRSLEGPPEGGGCRNPDGGRVHTSGRQCAVSRKLTRLPSHDLAVLPQGIYLKK